MKLRNWDTNLAVETFFEKGYASKYQVAQPACDERMIKQMFQTYAGNSTKMDQDGIVRFFADIKVDLEDPITLLISYRMKAQQQGEYTYE